VGYGVDHEADNKTGPDSSRQIKAQREELRGDGDFGDVRRVIGIL
jgi:hypothetical protein